MPAKKVEIEISAKIDALNQALAQAESKTRATMNRINAASRAPTGGGVGDSLGINVAANPFDIDKMEARRAQLVQRFNAETSRRAAAEQMENARRAAIEQAQATRREISRGAAGAQDYRRVVNAGGGAGSMDVNFAKSFETALKLGGAVKAVEFGIRGAAVAVSAFRGDADAAREAVQQLPIIGRLFAAEFALVEAFTKKTAVEMETIRRRTEESQIAAKKWADEYERVQRVESARKERINALDTEGRGIGAKGRSAELVAVNEEEESRARGISNVDELTRVWQNAALKRKEINERYDKEEARTRAQLVSEQRVAEMKYAGDDLAARQEEIRQQYKNQIADAASPKDRGLITSRMNYELLMAQREDTDKRYRERKEKAEELFDRQEAAREKAKDRLKQASDIIKGQKLQASDVGFLTRGVGTDRTAELLQINNRQQEETNRILREQLTKEKQKAAFVQAVGF